MLEILRIAIQHYGANSQIDVCIEEMAELIQALIKTKRYASDDHFDAFRDNVIEEIADVEIMLQQLRIIFNIDERDIYKKKNFKLDRLTERVEDEING